MEELEKATDQYKNRRARGPSSDLPPSNPPIRTDPLRAVPMPARPLHASSEASAESEETLQERRTKARHSKAAPEVPRSPTKKRTRIHISESSRDRKKQRAIVSGKPVSQGQSSPSKSPPPEEPPRQGQEEPSEATGPYECTESSHRTPTQEPGSSHSARVEPEQGVRSSPTTPSEKVEQTTDGSLQTTIPPASVVSEGGPEPSVEPVNELLLSVGQNQGVLQEEVAAAEVKAPLLDSHITAIRAQSPSSPNGPASPQVTFSGVSEPWSKKTTESFSTPCSSRVPAQPIPIQVMMPPLSAPEVLQEFKRFKAKVGSPPQKTVNPRVEELKQSFNSGLSGGISSNSCSSMEQAEKDIAEMYGLQALSQSQYVNLKNSLLHLKSLQSEDPQAVQKAAETEQGSTEYARTLSVLDSIMEEGSLLEDETTSVISRALELEKELNKLKEERTKLASDLSDKLAEAKMTSEKANLLKANLENSNLIIAEPKRLRLEMKAALARITAIAKDAGL